MPKLLCCGAPAARVIVATAVERPRGRGGANGLDYEGTKKVPFLNAIARTGGVGCCATPRASLSGAAVGRSSRSATIESPSKAKVDNLPVRYLRFNIYLVKLIFYIPPRWLRLHGTFICIKYLPNVIPTDPPPPMPSLETVI